MGLRPLGGRSGSAASPADIVAAVEDYLTANPVEGGGGTPITVDGAPVDSLDIDSSALAVGAQADYFTPLVRAAAFGQDFTYAVLSDSTGDEGDEFPRRALDLLAERHPAVRMELRQFSDGSQTYGAATVVNEGAEPTGGVIAHDTFSVAGAAVGQAADTEGTWLAGTGTVTKAGGVATPSANSGLAVLAPVQDATVTANMRVTTAGLSGSQSYRLGVGSSNAQLSGFRVEAVLILVTANQTNLLLRKYVNATDGVVTISNEDIDMGLDSVTDQPAEMVLSLNDRHVTATITVGATVTTREFDLEAGDYDGLGSYAGVAVAAAAGAITWDEVTVATPVIPTPTITCYNGSVAGKNPDYVPSRVAALLPTSMDAVLLAYGHNSLLTPNAFLTQLGAAVDAIEADQPGVDVWISSQNPEYSPFDPSRVAGHHARQARLPEWAATRGLGYLPAFEAFAASDDNGVGLVDGDGVHPNAAGSTLWARVVTGIQAPVEAAGGTSDLALYTACPLVAGRWYATASGRQVASQPGEGWEAGAPRVMARTTTLTGIGCNVTTAGSTGAVIRFGIRADSGGMPGEVLWQGTVDATTIGAKSANPGLAVTKGQALWFTIAVQGGATTRPTLTVIHDVGSLNIGDTDLDRALAEISAGYRTSGVTGALPASPTWQIWGSQIPKVVITSAS